MSKFLSVKDDSLTSIADSIRKKTGKTNKLTFPAEFVSEIDGIQTGGGGTPAADLLPKDVNFFDYDGTIIASYTEDEAKMLTELPTPPEHDGLVFQGWNCTLQEVIDNADAADVGAMYTTDDGATRLKIHIEDDARRDIKIQFYQTKSAGVVIDWGDGQTERSAAVTSLTYSEHEYENVGYYVIKIYPDSDCVVGLGGYRSQIVAIPNNGYSATDINYAPASFLYEVNIGNNVNTIKSAAFKYMMNLEIVSMPYSIDNIESAAFQASGIRYITIPASMVSLNGNTFYLSRKMINISIPPCLTIIQSYDFSNCESLRRIVISHIQNLGQSALWKDTNLKTLTINEENTFINSGVFTGCVSLVKIVFCGAVTRLQSPFTDLNSLRVVDFSHCETVPAIDQAGRLPSDCEILVPAALAEEWKSATNWTTYASRIKGV